MTTEFNKEYTTDELPPLLPRVTAFITRDSGSERELLIIRPTAVAPQLPDATVDMHETPVATVMRLQKTVLRAPARLERRIAVVRETLGENVRAVVRPTLLRTGPSHEATLMRFPLERGMHVKVAEWRDEFARVAYEEYSFHEDELAIATRRAGWLPVGLLAAQIEHHLFHLSAGETASAAETSAVWTPLSRANGLTPAHERWLERVRTLLAR